MFKLNIATSKKSKLEKVGLCSLCDYIIDLAWSPDESKIAAVTVEGEVFLIHVNKDNPRSEKIGEHKAGANSLSWRYDGQEFATGGQDGFVKVWDGSSGIGVCTLKAGDPWVSKVAYNPHSNILASSAGRHLKLWNEKRLPFYESTEHSSTIADMAWNPDGSGVAVAAYYGVTLHAPGKQKKPRKYKWKGSSLALAWSPDAEFIATGEQDSTVHFWHRKSGQDAQMWGFPTKVLELSWDSSGKWLATGGGSQVSLWDCSGSGPAGRKPRQFNDHNNKITQLAFQPEGQYLASSDADSLLFLWKPIQQDTIVDEKRLDSPASVLRWNKSGKLAVAQTNGNLLLLNLYEY